MENLTFRNAKRYDVSLILHFIIKLAKKKSKKRDCRNRGSFEKWLFEKKKEVVFSDSVGA